MKFSPESAIPKGTPIIADFTNISVIRRKRVKHLSSIVWPHRFASKIAKDSKTGCWNWTGATSSAPKFPQHRYGVYAVDGRDSRSLTYAHRFAYQFVNGLLLPGLRLDVDHACQNKLCVNPAHLRPLTRPDNLKLRKRVGRRPKKLGGGSQ